MKSAVHVLDLSLQCPLLCSVSVLRFFLYWDHYKLAYYQHPDLPHYETFPSPVPSFHNLQHFLIYLGSEAQLFYTHFSPICSFSKWLKISIIVSFSLASVSSSLFSLPSLDFNYLLPDLFQKCHKCLFSLSPMSILYRPFTLLPY